MTRAVSFAVAGMVVLRQAFDAPWLFAEWLAMADRHKLVYGALLVLPLAVAALLIWSVTRDNRTV